MRDYTKPPTEEFAMITENGTRYDTQWLTMMMSVMNDYWFDQWQLPHTTKDEFNRIDEFMHKIYYCWQQYLEDNHS